MRKIITNRILSLERSLCARRCRMASADGFQTAGVVPRRHAFTFSPVHIIRKFPTALKPRAGLRNKSKSLHRNLASAAHRWHAPPGLAAFRHWPTGWRKRFFLGEFLGFKDSGQYLLPGQKPIRNIRPR
jgi:hypothetical protein